MDIMLQIGQGWRLYMVEANATNHNASLQITTSKSGFVWLDQVSAMPLDTYKVYMHDGIGNAFFSFILF